MLILAYHRVNPEVRDGLSVSPETFREHLSALLDRGWRNSVLEEVLGEEPSNLPEQAFAVTLDDGYQDNYFHARPVLAELGLRATVYLVSSMIDSDRPFPWLKLDGPDDFDELDLHMTSAQLEDSRDVFTYGSHTMTHPMLSELATDAAREEIEGSKSSLESRLGSEVTTFCYPAGNFNAQTLDLVREAGYRAAVVTPNRHIPETMHTLHRVGIYSHITPRLFAIKTSRIFETAQRNRVFWESRARLSALRAR
ncbi:MAG TPA: polysaccharide deacetylase family protein [Acidimicrobiia bacterium]|nr:polysaccharide deacetylase family protein [Acidimicrobiia bacterium]